MSAAVAPDEDQIVLGECLELLPGLPSDFFSLIYLDPPFNTGRRQVRRTLRAVEDPEATRTGFGGRTYRTELLVPLQLPRPVRRLPRLPRSRGCRRRAGC